MNVTCLHVSANCNPKPNVLAFLAPHLLAFAFADQIAIYSLEQSRIISTISGKHCLIQIRRPVAQESIALLCMTWQGL